MNIERVIEGYLTLRNMKEELAKKHKEELAPFNEKLERLELHLRAHLQSQNLTSIAAKGVGTAYLETKTDAAVQDWDATLPWIRDTGNWEFLERRVAKSVVKDYVESHGQVPPGISLTPEVVVRVRKT
jgi:hypothetical protein